ncbi:MAG: carbonic anhydrase [Chloroflexota bacterium]
MHASDITPDEALQMLVEGNQRYTSGKAVHPHQSADRRTEVLAGQHPFVTVLSCADSRVPPEVFFDQGIGDLFIIRNAGNIIDDVVLGSMEYAAEHLGVPLVLILGHTKCGAVTATVQGGEAPGHIGSIVKTILPAVEITKGQEGDAVVNAIYANVHMTVEAVKHCAPILSEFVEKGRMKVVGAVYHLESGKVEFL